jgi:hypothetical protein
VQYDVTTTALSMVWVVVASGMALYAMSREVMRWSRLVGALALAWRSWRCTTPGWPPCAFPGKFTTRLLVLRDRS